MKAYYHGAKIEDILEYRQGNKHTWVIVKLAGKDSRIPVRTDHIVIEN